MRPCFYKNSPLLFLECFIFFGLLHLTACSSLQEDVHLKTIDKLTSSQGWQSIDLQSKPFSLRAHLSPHSKTVDTLTIYIEGDGSAWDHGSFPSADPTPQDPIGLKLALAQPEGVVAYLARPCQFITDPVLCKSNVWTSERFSQAAIESTKQAIDLLKQQTGAKKILLVGYSGGAAIALLVASQRKDIRAIVSVAGNINPHLWVEVLGLESLTGSLDPRQAIPLLQSIPQVYFIGGKDRVLPTLTSEEALKLLPENLRPRLVVINENGHVCCWVGQWPLLWSQYVKSIAR